MSEAAKTQSPTSGYVTSLEAISQLGLGSKQHLHILLKAGKLRSVQQGRRRYVASQSIESYLAGRKWCQGMRAAVAEWGLSEAEVALGWGWFERLLHLAEGHAAIVAHAQLALATITLREMSSGSSNRPATELAEVVRLLTSCRPLPGHTRLR